MIHLDLFSGIGGFALAVDRVWPGSTHIFCDNDLFCQEVLRKHWPDSKIYGDIRTITKESFATDSTDDGGRESSEPGGGGTHSIGLGDRTSTDILTGGFPCQPFSQAGRRRGTADDRYLWPEMLRVIRLTKPTWIIGENVGGFVTWNEGMVLEQVCTDLEGEGYEVQPFIIPAVSVNAPHRRDRVWIVANKSGKGLQGDAGTSLLEKRGERFTKGDGDDRNTLYKGLERREQLRQSSGEWLVTETGWKQNWLEVATRLCRVDDGIPRRVDRLKALGNAIVPQVAEEIFKAIKQI